MQKVNVHNNCKLQKIIYVNVFLKIFLNYLQIAQLTTPETLFHFKELYHQNFSQVSIFIKFSLILPLEKCYLKSDTEIFFALSSQFATLFFPWKRYWQQVYIMIKFQVILLVGLVTGTFGRQLIQSNIFPFDDDIGDENDFFVPPYKDYPAMARFLVHELGKMITFMRHFPPFFYSNMLFLIAKGANNLLT